MAEPVRPPPPAATSEQDRARQLVVTKRRATLLLGAVTVVFLLATVARSSATWVGYLQATAEASMVGGLADWFAVTALFRRPLGLPIPHTAVIVERKDQFAVTLGTFIQDSFLTPEAVTERVRAARVPARLGIWLSQPANAARVSAEAANAAVAVSDLLREDDVHEALEGVFRQRLGSVALAPMAGRALQFMTEGGRHAEALTATFGGLDRYLDQHREELRQRFGQTSPWWLPGAVEDRIVERLIDGVRAALHEMATEPSHPMRRELEARIRQLASDLQTSPAWKARGDQIRDEFLSDSQIHRWVAALWAEVRQELRAQAADPGSEVRQRLTDAIVSSGLRLQEDPALSERVEEGLVSATCYVVEHFDGEIASLVSGTIARWDGRETARRLELLLGPDLQYIRINGTVVGALAGLGLHTIALALR